MSSLPTASGPSRRRSRRRTPTRSRSGGYEPCGRSAWTGRCSGVDATSKVSSTNMCGTTTTSGRTEASRSGRPGVSRSEVDMRRLRLLPAFGVGTVSAVSSTSITWSWHDVRVSDSLWRLGLSSGLVGWLDVGGLPAKTGRWGGPPRCALSATLMSCEDLLRGLPPCLAAASPVADLLGHGVALGDDLPGLIWGERGVEVAGGVGGTVKGGAQQPVAGLGDGLALAVAVASLGRAWGKPGEGSKPAGGREPVGGAHGGGQGGPTDLGQAGQGAGQLERARPGGSSTPAGRHGARAQLGGPEQADLGLDLGGQVGEGHRGVVVVQLQRGVGGVEPLGGATGVLLAV